MGGIADYSGSLVLQRPIAEATFAALQPADQPSIEIISTRHETGEKPRVFDMSLASLAPGGEPISYAEAREFFHRDSANHWAAYVAGAFLVLMRETGARFSTGAKVLIASSVPEGKGVASSAALEVASMQGIASIFGISLEADPTGPALPKGGESGRGCTVRRDGSDDLRPWHRRLVARPALPAGRTASFRTCV